MDPINTKFLRQLIRTLERIERRLDTPLNQHRYPEGKQQQSSKEQGQDQRPIEIRSVLSLPISVKRYYESEQRERASIWRKAKDVLEYVGVMTAISLAVLTWFTLQKVSSQAAAARDQVGMMQQQMEMTDRPWIKLVSAKPTQELHFMDLTSGMLASAGLTVIAENIGHSVALNVFLQARMTFAYDTKVLEREQESACFSPDRTQPSPALNLFPGDNSGSSLFMIGTVDVPNRDKSSPPHLLAHSAPPDAWGDTWIASPKFVGCVVYTIASSQKEHRTGFIYGLTQEIARKNSPFGTSYYPDYFKVGTSIPKERLSAEQYALGITAN